MKSSVEILRESLNDEIINRILSCYRLSKIAYDEIIKKIGENTASIYFSNLRQHVFTFCLNESLNQLKSDPYCPISADSKVVNNFQRKNPMICFPNCVLTTVKTYKRDSLKKKKYMIKLAENNGEYDQQLCLSYKTNDICPPPYYAIITYNYNYVKGEYDFIDVLMPDKYCQNILLKISLLSYIDKDIFVNTNDEEKMLARIKKNADKKYGING